VNKRIETYFKSYTEAAPLAVFRIFFGFMMCVSIIRFWSYGWIDKFYIQPDFHFKFYGFEWVQPFGVYTYLIFALCLLSAFCVMIGFKYRVAMALFFLSFTYIELLDKTMYLNHYYFVSVCSFILIFLPAHVYFSVDAKRSENAYSLVPRWTIDVLKLFIAIVYFYAGLTKLNSDWLLDATPLNIWLPSKFDIPFIGDFMGQEWVHYAFSWIGAGYDLCIPFLLLYKRTRPYAFVVVVIFHVMTRVLFPIGMFPYIMIVSALIFFDARFHKKLIYAFAKACKFPLNTLNKSRKYAPAHAAFMQLSKVILICVMTVQLVLPWRYALYPGELFWTEEGYRFSWRVMLMEKAGYAQFKIVDQVSGKRFYVDNSDFLTPIQEKQMSFQPDFILEYAHYLRDHFEAQGHQNVAVFADVQVTLNGRLSSQFIDPTINLAVEKESFKHKNWITPFTDEIKGL